MEKITFIKKILPIVAACAVVICILVVAFSEGDNNKSVKHKTTNAPDATKAADVKLTGVITGIDTKEKEIIIYSVKYEEPMIFKYSGATQIDNRYGKALAVSQVRIGDIYDVEYLREDMRLTKMSESTEAWEYQGLSNFEFRSSGNVMTINGARYKFTKGISITLDDVVIDKSKIIEGDEVTAKGIGNVVWSLVVTKSHGTIRFENSDALIGGKVMVGNYDAVDMTENTLIEVTEGTYNVQFVNGKLHGEKVVTVKRNDTVKVDLSDIYLENEDVALVNFKIKPSAAMLYVDGEAKSHTEPFELEYGKHEIKVELEGYETYSGSQIIDESGVTINVNLTESPEDEEEGDDGAKEDEEEEEPKGDDTDESVSSENDGDNTQYADDSSTENEDENEEENDEDSPSKYADGSGGVG